MSFDNIKKMLLDGKINIKQAIYEAHEEGLGFHQIQNLYKISEKIDVNEIAGDMEQSLEEMTAAPAPVAPPQPKPAKPVAPPRPSRPSPFRPPQPRTMPKPKAKGGRGSRGAVPAPEAPPKEAPPREAPPKPSTPPTPRPSKPNPFRPPQPRTMPKPKARGYDSAAPAAPEAPPREAPPKPSAPPTPRPSKPNPFRPPQPRTMPKPKARRPVGDQDGMIEMISSTVVPIMEAYEDESHRSTQDFWRDLPRNKEHTFGKHPILAMHGANLSKDAFDFTSEKMQQSGGAVNPHQFMQIVMQIMQLESRHKDELQELAKDITVKIWGVPREMLETDLGPMDMGGGGDDFGGGGGEEEEEEAPELTDEIRPQVNKRISMNTMTQGSAVHAMYSMHHLVDRAINKISPQLLQLYNRVASGSVHQYWMIDIPAIAAQLKNMKAGEVRVEFPEGRQEEPEIDPEEGLGDEDQWQEGRDPIVRASAVIFPVLCQELSKGVMEVLTMHGLSNLDDEQSKAVIHHGDKLEDEPWLIQVGPALWRKFLTVVPKGIRMADIITALSLQEPDEVHKILTATLEHPENAKQLLQELLKDPEEFDIDEPGNEFQEPEEPVY